MVLPAVLARLWSGGGQRSPAYWLLGLAVVALLAADAAFGVAILHGPFSPGGPIDAGYSLFLVGCGAAALHPSMARLAVAGPPVAARRPRGASPGSGPRPSSPRACRWWSGCAAGSIFMFVLIVARTQGLTRKVPQQDQRTRIAHDLHHGPAQQLAVLNYDVYRARKRLADLLGRVGGDA